MSTGTTMASSDVPSDTQIQRHENPTLTVQFTWKKWQGKILDARNPGSDPLYSIHFPFKLISRSIPTMIFTKALSDEVIGSGKLNMVSINPDYELHGHKAELLAQKRFRTLYTHRSLNFSDTDTPITMTWSSEAGFKTWDFVCVDEQQNAVAKFSGNPWGVTNIGKIEFDGPKKHDRAAQEEIIVTGITLFYCMLVRCNSIFNLFGAVFTRPGRKEHVDPPPRDRTDEEALEHPSS